MDDFNKENKNDDLSTRGEKAKFSAQENPNSSSDQNTEKADLNAPTSKALIDKILNVTLTIKAKFPELSKFLDETPGSELDYHNPEISLQDLKDYYQSLKAILDKYNLEHPKD